MLGGEEARWPTTQARMDQLNQEATLHCAVPSVVFRPVPFLLKGELNFRRSTVVLNAHRLLGESSEGSGVRFDTEALLILVTIFKT